MAVKKKNRREMRFMTKQERALRDLMSDHSVSQAEIADHEGVSEPAITQRLQRLTPSKYEEFKDLILALSKKQPQKVAS